jgi:hypothetical protein
LAASAALAVSDVPIKEVISEVRGWPTERRVYCKPYQDGSCQLRYEFHRSSYREEPDDGGR